jgi:hypothetical protein
MELESTVRLLDARAIQWSVTGLFSRDRNRLVRSTSGADIALQTNLGYETRLVPGYPVDGIWAQPILGYYDANGDGVIAPSEVRVGDSLVYVGEAQPSSQLTLSTSLSLLNNSITINTAADYQQGITQVLGGGALSGGLNPNADLWLNDPAVSPGLFAAIVASNQTAIGLAQTVNVLRWKSLSVSYLVPPSLSRRIHLPTLQVALQGNNLALHSNYRGKDPNVSGTAFGNFMVDTGQLPTPRLWTLNVRIN